MTNAKFLPALTVFLLAVLACNGTSSPAEPNIRPTAQTIPLTEAGVPRVSAAESQAAVESEQAIVVDVRSTEAYTQEHIRGALNIPLAEIERDPAGVNLDKNRWIITYCT